MVAYYTLVRKELLRFLRSWPQTLLPPAITVFLYFVIFGSFIGQRIGMMQGIDYIQYIIPGLVMMSVINSSYANVVGSFYISKFQREIEEVLVSPTPIYVIIAGYVTGGVLRGIVVGVIVTLISLFFSTPTLYNPWIVIIYFLLAASAFACGGLINGIFANKFDDIVMFSTFVLTPLTYLGGVFFSIQELPSHWQFLSKLNPILYMVDGLRFGYYGFSDVSLVASLAVLIVSNILLLSTSFVLLQRGVGIKT